MDSSDVFSSLTAPLMHDFLERMRQPSAADLVKSIKSFIVSFSNNAPDPEKDSASIQEFFIKMEQAFRAHSLWDGCSEEELESAGEGLEKYVMTKLFTRVFASLPEDVKCDEQLSEKMALIQQFIRPENLDIKPTFQNETSWLLAQKELQKINMFKAPRDKLSCILNCCKVINNLLLNASIASEENPPGADEFLPVLIYVTLKANPPQLHSNLLYIQRYRRQSRLVSEAAYFFTNMLSATSFILNIDANSLSMDEAEYEKNMESAKAIQSGLMNSVEKNLPNQTKDTRTEAVQSKLLFNVKSELSNSLPTDGHPSQASAKNSEEGPDANRQFSMSKIPSVSDLEEKGAAELLKADNPSGTFQTYPYLYCTVSDLTVSDVENLLNSYKELVLKYVCLSNGVASASLSLSSRLSSPQLHDQAEAKKVSEHTMPVDTKNEKFDDGTREKGSDGRYLLPTEASESEVSQD